MTPSLGRRLWLIVGALVALTAVLVVISGSGSTARVTVAEVVRGNLSSVVSSNGKVEPIAPDSFRAAFDTFVDHVDTVEGQQVKKGQLLFALDDTGVLAELAQARADLATQQDLLRTAKAGGQAAQVAKAAADLQKAQASRDQLSRENQELLKLVGEKAATTDELEHNRLLLTEAEADVQVLEKTKTTLEQQAKLDTERITLLVEHANAQIRDLEDKEASTHGRASIDGTLYSLPIHPGDYVKEGDLLAEVADLHHVRIRAFIDEPDLGQLAVGQPVEIFWDAHPDRVWTGRTEAVPEQVINHGTRSVGELLCSVSNDRLDLLPNTTVDVRIHVSERPNVLVIPRGAVLADGNRRFVYQVDGDRIHRRDIQIGIANPTMIEVVSGLNQGDEIALPGNVSLRENLRIRPVPPE